MNLGLNERLYDALKKATSIFIIVAVTVLMYFCFVSLRDSQPVFSASQDVLSSDTLASRLVGGAYNPGEQAWRVDIDIDSSVSEISILAFRSGKAAQTAAVQEEGVTVSEVAFSQENTLISRAVVPVSSFEGSESAGVRAISLVLKGVNPAGPGVVYVGPQQSMDSLMGISAYIGLFEIGLLVAMVVYGSTLYYYKRTEDYMLRYVLYILVLLFQAVLFTTAWHVPIADLGVFGRPFAMFTRVAAYMLSFYIAFRLMNIEMNAVARIIFSGRAIVLVGLIAAAITAFYGSVAEPFLALAFNSLALATAVYICIIANPEDTLIAAVLLVSVLISANASFFGFLNLSDSLVFCVLFTTAPLFSLPFALVVMFNVNRLFATKFKEQELLSERLDSLVDLRTRELRVKEAQRRQMMLNIFHDLRTPLFVTKGCLEAVGDNPKLAAEKIPIAESRIEFMTNLTNDLFQLAKLEEGRVLFAEDPINLKRILEEMASSWAEYKTSSGIVVSVSANDDIVIVGDRMRLMEAMQNLVDNAVHHSPINGEVRVDASLCESGATICVIDQGPGLTEAECSKIFEYYYTNSRSGTSEGTGIGLPIAKEIIEHMEGSISVKSTLGEGTTFVVEFPAVIDMDTE